MRGTAVHHITGLRQPRSVRTVLTGVVGKRQKMGMKMRRRPSAARRQARPLLHLCHAILCTWVNNERPGRRAGRQALTSKYSICCSHAENGATPAAPPAATSAAGLPEEAESVRRNGVAASSRTQPV